MTERISKLLPLVARIGLGGVFAFSAWTKFVDIEGFAAQVLSYRIFSGSALALSFAWTFAVFEGAIGVAFLAVRAPGRLLHVLAAGLLAAFSALLAYAWLALGLEDCGCFGAVVKMSPQVSLLKNSLLIGAVAI